MTMPKQPLYPVLFIAGLLDGTQPNTARGLYITVRQP